MYSFKVKQLSKMTNEMEDIYGVVAGENFRESLACVLEYFNENEVEEITLSYINDSQILIAPKFIVDTIKSENNI